jgi:hypothetical protein
MMRLPVVDPLDRLEIASPCEVPWEGMPGDDRIRFCFSCRQNVYNVQAMSRAEASRLIRRAQGRLCVQLYRRPDGTVITADCWTVLRQARRRGALAFAGMCFLVLWAEIAAQAVGLKTLLGWSRPAARPVPVEVREPPTPPAPPKVYKRGQAHLGGI